MSSSSANITYNEKELYVEYDSTPYVPAVYYLSNGDPGYPEEGGDFEITMVLEDGNDITDSFDDNDFYEMEQLIVDSYDGDY